MTETWHSQFNPQQFLSRVNIDNLVEINKVYDDEKRVLQLLSPCILCDGTDGPGLLLNDKSYLCKSCLKEVAQIKYPERYEELRKRYLANCEARNLARAALIRECIYRKLSKVSLLAFFVSLLLLYFHIAFIEVPGAFLLVYYNFKSRHGRKIKKWDTLYPIPAEPELKHFHDPSVELSLRDKKILKIFNNWPGYPPFWDYLREVVLERDFGRCQVTGCPSRVALHVHHRVPVSKGGEHIPTNLVALCTFHHALEPAEGHERLWGKIKTQYFTIVRAHQRRRSFSQISYGVRAHVRRLQLTQKSELETIINYYGMNCPSCGSNKLDVNLIKNSQQICVTCLQCEKKWLGKRQLTEETGPRLAELLNVTCNKGIWSARWDMLEARSDSVFRLLSSSGPISNRYPRNTTSTRSQMRLCPKCGSPMRLIKPKPGQQWRPFWGCSKYRSTGCRGR